MAKTQLMLLPSCSQELIQRVRNNGQLEILKVPHLIVLSQAPAIRPQTGRVPLSAECVRQVEQSLALSCRYEDEAGGNAVCHQLRCAATALQLIKPISDFLNLWMQLDDENTPELAARDIADLGKRIGPEPYLSYQQHNCLTEGDVKRASLLMPSLNTALQPGNGSWMHPRLAIHRALVFFCQGYTVPHRDLKQFLWAAGLDCLYASKLDRKKQGSREIGRRMCTFLDANLKLYEADIVAVPTHQDQRNRKMVQDVVSDIFKLRNALAHGLSVPDAGWLSRQDQPVESGYAYQLIEQTEIALRLTLIKLLENQPLFDIFSDASRLDAYFELGAAGILAGIPCRALLE